MRDDEDMIDTDEGKRSAQKLANWTYYGMGEHMTEWDRDGMTAWFARDMKNAGYTPDEALRFVKLTERMVDGDPWES